MNKIFRDFLLLVTSEWRRTRLHVAPRDRVIDPWWIGADLEGSRRVLVGVKCRKNLRKGVKSVCQDNQCHCLNLNVTL